MKGSLHISENDYLKGLIVDDEIHYSQLSGINEVSCPVGVKGCEFSDFINYESNNLCSSAIFKENLFPPIRSSENYSFWYSKTPNDFSKVFGAVDYLTGYEVLNSSLLAYEKSVEYFKSDLLHLPYLTYNLNKDISNLEAKIFTELKSLNEQEAKWTSLSDFAEEYKGYLKSRMKNYGLNSVMNLIK